MRKIKENRKMKGREKTRKKKKQKSLENAVERIKTAETKTLRKTGGNTKNKI